MILEKISYGRQLLIALLAMIPFCAFAERYTLVSDASLLADGDTVIIAAAYNNQWYAMSSATDKAAEIEVDDTSISDGMEAAKFCVIATADKDFPLSFYDIATGKYIGNGTASNALKWGADNNAHGFCAAYTPAEERNTLTFNNPEKSHLYCNWRSTEPLFRIYGEQTASNYCGPRIFKLEKKETPSQPDTPPVTDDKNKVLTPTFVGERVMEVGSQIEIECATPDAKIYYAFEGDPTQASYPYRRPLTFTDPDIYYLSAYAEKENMITSDTAKICLTVFDPENVEIECGIIFREQKISYGKNKQVIWTANNGLEFATVATVAENYTYPALFSNEYLRLYRKSHNTITVTAPEGYYFICVMGYTQDAAIVTFTANGIPSDEQVDGGVVSYYFPENKTNFFSFDVNDAINDAYGYKNKGANCNFIGFDFIIAPYLYADLTIHDAKPYSCNIDTEAKTISYKREYDSALWQGLYVPFAIEASHFDKVAKFVGAEGEEVYFEVVSGTLQPHTPYIVKPKYAPSTVMYPAADTHLYAATSQTLVHDGYELCGTYSAITDASAYSLTDQGDFRIATEPIQPFRIYIKTPAAITAQGTPLKIILKGIEYDKSESITSANDTESRCYDTLGRLSHKAKGIQILDGKKIVRW